MFVHFQVYICGEAHTTHYSGIFIIYNPCTYVLSDLLSHPHVPSLFPGIPMCYCLFPCIPLHVNVSPAILMCFCVFCAFIMVIPIQQLQIHCICSREALYVQLTIHGLNIQNSVHAVFATYMRQYTIETSRTCDLSVLSPPQQVTFST